MSASWVPTESLGDKGDIAAVTVREGNWSREKVSARVWKKDPTLWPKAPPAEVPDRMGWIDLPEAMLAQVAELTEFSREVRGEGIEHVVLMGMGGSSLAPQVFREVFPPLGGYPDLRVLDSTHPEAVRAIAEKLEPKSTLFIVSSKSGTTLEPNVFHEFFWKRLSDAKVAPGPHFVAITDPGTPLEALAQKQKFRRVFRALSTVGGRYSALTHFGLVPAALLGVDLRGLLDHARAMARACGPDLDPPQNPGLHLGAVLGELAKVGRDKLTLHASGRLRPFPVWLEQLVAESTGKLGTGIVPVAGEPFAGREAYGRDRVFVEIQDPAHVDTALQDFMRQREAHGQPVVRFEISDPLALGAEFFRWELAVAMAGSVIGIDPFDQPDVEFAKELARKAMAASGTAGSTAPAVATVSASEAKTLRAAVSAWTSQAKAEDYVAIQAYLDPTEGHAHLLEGLERDLLSTLKVATTLGFGPRFLHSTGQLHKGGPPSGLFLQIVDAPTRDLPVPGEPLTFAGIIRAQALGDAQALLSRKRRLLRVDVGQDVAGGLQRLREAVRG